jgi:hypothetical protein
MSFKRQLIIQIKKNPVILNYIEFIPFSESARPSLALDLLMLDIDQFF